MSQLVGVEEVIIGSKGDPKVKYAWGIGTTMNNEIEELDLYKGLLILKSQMIHVMNMVGDNMIDLISIINKYIPKRTNHLISNYLANNSRMKHFLVMKQ